MNRRLSKNSTSKRPSNLVQTIERVDNLLVILSKSPEGLRLGELAESVHLPKGTTHRLISSLAYFNYVQQDPVDRKYKLGFKLATLGNLLLDQLDLRNLARPHLLEMAQKSNEAAHLVVLDNDESLYIDKIQLSYDGLHMASRIGYRAPLHCTAVGKVLIASLPDTEIDRIIKNKGLPIHTRQTLAETEKLKSNLEIVREKGYALDNEEHSEGVRCVAAPVYNIDGEVVAAISVSAPSIRVTLAVAEQSIKPLVVKTARIISKQLGYVS